jgi:putative protease
VASVSGASLLLDRDHGLAPGDGLAFPGRGGRVAGTHVNASEGRRVTVQSPAGIRAGQEVFRSFDHAWHKRLRSAAVERRIGVAARLDFPEGPEAPEGPGGRARLTLRDEDGCGAEALSDEACGPPKNAGLFALAAKGALSRLGDTPFRLDECSVAPDGFLPLGQLNRLRRRAAALLVQARIDSHPRRPGRSPGAPAAPLGQRRLGHEWNVSNSLARAFYSRHGAVEIEPALELAPAPAPGLVVMATRLCPKYELGRCPGHKNGAPAKETAGQGGPLYLRNGDTALACEFDCEACVVRLRLARAGLLELL